MNTVVKAIVISSLALAGFLVFVWYGIPAMLPAAEASIRTINRAADDHERIKASGAEQKLAEYVGGDDQTFGDRLKQVGSEAGARRLIRHAALGRGYALLPRLAPKPILTEANKWVSFNIPVGEPIDVAVWGKFCHGYEDCRDPDGKPSLPLPGRYEGMKTVLEWEAQATPVPERYDPTLIPANFRELVGVESKPIPGQYGEALGRLCDAVFCGPGFPIRFQAQILPPSDGRKTFLEFSRNGFVAYMFGGYDPTVDTADGKFMFRVIFPNGTIIEPSSSN
ncbi:MAG: hypothetical protein HY336_01550 [Candidatus Doudnabacteria bacterium]|nr:hypothetical protein [Candidatus Doudnabacteria bacterium]